MTVTIHSYIPDPRSKDGTVKDSESSPMYLFRSTLDRYILIPKDLLVSLELIPGKVVGKTLYATEYHTLYDKEIVSTLLTNFQIKP